MRTQPGAPYQGTQLSRRVRDTQEAEGATPSVPTIHAPVAQLPERDASNVTVAGESPAGSASFE